MGLVSGLSLANHSDSESFLVAQALFSKMDASKKDSGRWSDMWCLLLTFLDFFWLVLAYKSSMFLTRTSCRKTIHANSYYGTWPGWVVSVSVLLLTDPLLKQ